MTEAAQVAQYHKACTHLIHFRHIAMVRPTTDFKASFKHSLNNEESINLIERLTLTRADLVNVLHNSNPPEEKIAIVDNYLPSIFLLMNTLTTQNPKPTFDKSINFEWRGPMTPGEEYFKSSDVIYEVMMALYAKAMLHNAAAKHLVDTDPLNFLTEAGKHLLTASSIMTHLSENILSLRWSHSLSPKAPNPIDVNPTLCKALGMYFKASAQAMAAVKALSNESTPALIKARLCIAVHVSMKQTLETLTSITGVADMHSELCTHVAVMRELYMGLVCTHLAQSNFDKKEMGLTMGFCNAAKRCLVEQPSSSSWSSSKYQPRSPGLPKLAGYHQGTLKAAVEVLTYKLDTLHKAADQDNRFIYFQVVPSTLPDLPPEANVMNPVPYEEPAYSGPPVVFVYKPPKGFIGTIFSSLMGSDEPNAKPSATAVTAPMDNASAPPAPGADWAVAAGSGGASPATQAQADEAYARYLQQQYNKEAQAQAPLPPVASNGVNYPRL